MSRLLRRAQPQGRTTSQPRRRATTRNPRQLWVAGVAAAAYVGLGLYASGRPEHWERSTLAEVNDQHGLGPVLLLPQQLGTPWVLPALAAGALVARRPHLAGSAAVALPVEKGLEFAVKKLLNRGRPAQDTDWTRLRDDAPADGTSYPSGHAARAFAAAVLLGPHASPPVIALVAVNAAAVTVRRLHQGAHFPLDVLGGALLGTAVGSGLTYVVGVPRRD